MKKLGLVIAAAAIVGFAGTAFAAEKPPTAGDLNKATKASCGTPGQNTYPTPEGVPMPANVFAKMRNEARKAGDSLNCDNQQLPL